MTDLLDDLKRQYSGAKYTLETIPLATSYIEDQQSLARLRSFLSQGLHAIQRLSNVCINLRCTYKSWEDYETDLVPTINLLSIDIHDLISNLYHVHEYFADQRKILILLLRIIFKIRTRLETFLCENKCWDDKGELRRGLAL